MNGTRAMASPTGTSRADRALDEGLADDSVGQGLAMVPEQEGEQLGMMPAGSAADRSQQRGQLLVGRSGAGTAHDLVEEHGGQVVEQRGPVGHVPVDGHGGHPQLGGHPAHGQVAEAALVGHLEGGVEDHAPVDQLFEEHAARLPRGCHDRFTELPWSFVKQKRYTP